MQIFYLNYLTTFAFWTNVLVASAHMTLTEKTPNILINAALSLSFGVMVVGSLISMDWGYQFSLLWNWRNLFTHVLPFVVVVIALYIRPVKPSNLLTTVLAALVVPIVYLCVRGSGQTERDYQRVSPQTFLIESVPIFIATLFLPPLVQHWISP